MTTSNDRSALSPKRQLRWSTARAIRIGTIALGLSFIMGQTDCGETTDEGEILPNRVLVEAPMLTIDNTGDEREEPYIVSFNWEATSAAFGDNPASGIADYDFRGANQGPWPLRLDARNNERVLIGEDVGKIDFEFPEVPATEDATGFNHVKMAGLTMCAFEADDPGGQASFKTEVEKFAVALRGGLKGAYSTQLFGNDSTRAAFRGVYENLITQTDEAWRGLDEDEQEESRPLYDAILRQLADAIDMLDLQDKQLRPKVNAGAVLGYVGTAFKVLPNLISLFKKKRKPDPDDFVGCASIIYVGVPFDIWNEQEASGVATCTAGTGGAQDLAVCAINEEGPTTLRFAPPLDDDEPNRRWLAELEVRRGNTPFKADGEPLIDRAAYRYATVASNRTETLAMPDVNGPSKLCGSGVTGECRIHFAHMVNYESQSRGRHSYEITEKTGGRYEIEVDGEADVGNVGVRLSTFVLPDYVRVHREIVDLDASGKNVTVADHVSYPSWYSSSRGIVITELLSIQQQGGKFAGVNYFADDHPPNREVHMLLRRYGQIGLNISSGEMRARVRVTFLSWDDSSKVDVSEADVISDDDKDEPPGFPEFAEIDWFMPFAEHHTSATLYFPTQLWSTLDWPETSFSLRAVGAEVRDFNDPKIRLYAQHAYAGFPDRAYVEGRVVNLRFK